MNDSRFDDLLRLWQDGEASASDLRELETLLRNDPQLRRELVAVSLLDVHLYRRYAPAAPARKIPRWRPLEAVAAIVVFAVSAFLLGRLFVRHDEPANRVAAGEVWSDGARAASLLEGHSFEVRGSAAASLHLKDGSRAILSPGSAGSLKPGPEIELARGSGSFALRGAYRLSTPVGALTAADAEFQVVVRKTPKELVVVVARGSAAVADTWGRHETVSVGERRSFGPPPPSGGVDYARLLDGASLGLLEAIDRATAVAPGVPLKAALENEDGRAVFSVDVAFEGKVREIDVDPKTGKVLEDDSDDEDRSQLAAALKTPLKAAIARALEAVPGRAVDAEAELKNGRARFEIRILTADGVKEVKVDGETGDIRTEKK